MGRYSPIVVSLAVEFRVPGVAGMGELDAADATSEAVFVPACVCDPHQVPIVDFLPTTLTHFISFFTFY
jgi:hypothetical protein